MSGDKSGWLIRNSPLLLLTLDEKLTCHSMSETWRNRLEPRLMVMKAILASDLFDFEDNEVLHEQFNTLAKDGVSIENEAAGLLMADEILPCRLEAWRACNDDGSFCIIVSATDVSKYLEASEELIQLQSEHRMILDAAGEGIYGLDSSGRITFGNAAAETIVGWRTEDMLGQTSHDVHHHSHSDGSKYPRDDCPIYAALKDGEVHHVETEVFWHADGSAIPVEYTSTPILKNGKPEGAVVIFKDVSQRKALEKQRTEAFEEIKQLKEQLEQERDYLRDELNTASQYGEIIGESQGLKRSLVQIEAVATTTANVLILGESGTGKELIARAIHQKSNRAGKPLVKVNCASIPRDLFESEFFGHVKGAFTGAHQDRTGRIQLANGGTLFLDEVGEIPLSQQGKLLRALQEHEFERVGDDKTIKADVRIVAATNRNLEEEVSAGRFREDLYYRLSVFPVTVPPLRDRIEDIAPLALHFIELFANDSGREPLKLSRQQVALLQQHQWPGNIRELKNVIERSAILSSGTRIRIDLALPAFQSREQFQKGAPIANQPGEFVTDDEIRQIEKINMIAVLRYTNWQVWGDGGAAELLGIKPSTMNYRMKSFGIRKET